MALMFNTSPYNQAGGVQQDYGFGNPLQDIFGAPPAVPGVAAPVIIPPSAPQAPNEGGGGEGGGGGTGTPGTGFGDEFRKITGAQKVASAVPGPLGWAATAKTGYDKLNNIDWTDNARKSLGLPEIAGKEAAKAFVPFVDDPYQGEVGTGLDVYNANRGVKNTAGEGTGVFDRVGNTGAGRALSTGPRGEVKQTVDVWGNTKGMTLDDQGRLVGDPNFSGITPRQMEVSIEDIAKAGPQNVPQIAARPATPYGGAEDPNFNPGSNLTAKDMLDMISNFMSGPPQSKPGNMSQAPAGFLGQFSPAPPTLPNIAPPGGGGGGGMPPPPGGGGGGYESGGFESGAQAAADYESGANWGL